MKKINKPLTLILVLGMMIGIFAAVGITGGASEGYSGTPAAPAQITSENYHLYGFTASNWSAYNGYYAITNAEELYGWRDTLGNAVLINDIVVNTGDMVAAGDAGTPPVYTWSAIESFDGVLDGRGHSISGLYIVEGSDGTYKFTAFIERLYGTIKNLTISNTYVRATSSYNAVIVSLLSNGSQGIFNCKVDSNVKAYTESRFGAFVGHGDNLSITLENCVSLADIEQKNARYVGAIIGGGVDKAIFTNCYYTNTEISGVGDNLSSFDASGMSCVSVASHTCLTMDHPAVVASCYSKGSTAYTDCMICGKVLSGIKYETDYSHGDFTYTAHTTDAEKHMATCTDCGDYSFEEVHSFDSDYTCVCTAQAVASVTTVGGVTTYYADIYNAAAYAASQDNCNMVLLSDVDLGEGDGLFDGIRDKKNVTLDLNGKTIQSYNSYTIYWQIYGYEEEHVTLTINDSVGTGKVVNGKFDAVEASSNLVINGGIYEAGIGNKTQAFAICIDSNALSYRDTVTINGGSFKSNNGIYVSQLAFCVIDDGVFEGVNTVIHSGKAGQLVIKGGNFPGGITLAGYADPLAQLLAPDFYVKNAEGRVISTENTTAIKGSVTVSKGANLQDAVVTVDSEGLIYNGSEHKPTVTVTVDGKTVEPANYTLSYANNINAGEATVTVTAKGGIYTGSKTVIFTIEKAIPVVTPPTPKEGLPFTNLYFYLTAQVATTTGGKLMYKVNDGEWGNATVLDGIWPAGTYTVYYKVVGNENYESVDEGAFITVTILQQQLDKINPTVTLSPERFVYDGTAKMPEVSIVTSLPYSNHPGAKATLEVNKDFTVTYSDNVNAGIATVTIRGIGNFQGTLTRTFTISKAALTVTADNKSVCVGTTLPTLTYTVEGLIDGEALPIEVALNTEATVGAVGDYGITVSGAEASDNYTVTYVGGTLTVRDHAYNSGVVTITPTCMAGGEKTYTCSHDSTHTYTEPLPNDENEHDWNEGAVTTNPTCSALGTKTFTCARNDAHTYTEDVAIDENAHAWNEGVITNQPTCTEKGVKTYTCTHNSEHTRIEDAAALGHKYDNACDADCNACGEARTSAEHYSENADGKCDECGESFELSGGAVAGIAVGSWAAVGLGGFSLFWFVLKKKKWSDLVGIFKK